jgi:UV excision repair protein RAD23
LQVTAVKKQIEESQGKESFPCSQQLLIHQGKVLKDDTSMEDNTVSENGFLVVMLTKVSFCSSSDQSIRAINMSGQIDAAGQISLCRHVAVSSKPLIVSECGTLR